mgnify:FL=1|jgi:hypothetical protein|tara:strand:+ start:322 stop:519 length:198 start_codon:yes stop_codon:yes gene_type:complete
MNRGPCSVTDDPYSDASDYFEGVGVYAEKLQPDPDELYDQMKSSMEPLITPFEGDNHENNTTIRS